MNINFSKKILNLIFNFFYPSFCKSCSCLIEQDSIFCSNCYKKIKPIVSSFLQITSTKSIKVFAVSDYKEPLKSLILEKGYSQNILASRQLGQIIYEKSVIKYLDIDFLIPIPLHWTRFAKRGYNQALVMAQELGKKLQVPVLDILKRDKKTAFQSSLSFELRQNNVKDVFVINPKYNKLYLLEFLKDKNIILVDDLLTTGATLKNSARVLIKFKPKSINAVVACRVV